ncbi:MAG: BACON domain-containing carbohydrate-binding protein [Vicinamibacterales bacterium]
MQSARLPAFLALAAASVLSLACPESPTKPTPTPCTYTVAPQSLSFGENGGSAAIDVTTQAGCTWTASASAGASWLTLGTAGGSGSGSVGVTAAANAAMEGRTASLAIAGATVSVAQSGLAPCTFAIAPASAAVLDDAGTGSFGLSTLSYCGWTATSDAAWLTVTTGSGMGSADIPFAYARNDATTPRVGHITVEGLVFVVTQAGDSGGPVTCDYSVAPVTFDVCLTPLTLAATLTTAAGCGWTTTSSVPWITILEGADATGPGPVRFVVDENYDAPRFGVVMVRWPTPTAGQNLQVHQAGCYYAVTRDLFTIPAAGASDRFDVLQQSDPISCGGALQDRCLWSAVADVPWITITSPMPRQGDNPVTFTVAPNGTGASRVGTITVRDRVVRIEQGG